MLRYLTQSEFQTYPKLIDTMFQDRAAQFQNRLGWEVTVDENGWERDQYDDEDALYAIWERADGSHGASMRIRSTLQPVMVNDFFGHISGQKFRHPLIWESTRFCLTLRDSEEARRLSTIIMLSGCEVGLFFGLDRAVAVFDPRIMRIYRQIGWPPLVHGNEGRGRNAIWVGSWGFSEQIRQKLCTKAGLAPELSRYWIERSMRHHTALAA